MAPFSPKIPTRGCGGRKEKEEVEALFLKA
jgi:hypothetical protein